MLHESVDRGPWISTTGRRINAGQVECCTRRRRAEAVERNPYLQYELAHVDPFVRDIWCLRAESRAPRSSGGGLGNRRVGVEGSLDVQHDIDLVRDDDLAAVSDQVLPRNDRPAQRAQARGSSDIAARLTAWDETAEDLDHAGESDFQARIDTDTMTPRQAAETIAALATVAATAQGAQPQ